VMRAAAPSRSRCTTRPRCSTHSHRWPAANNRYSHSNRSAPCWHESVAALNAPEVNGTTSEFKTIGTETVPLTGTRTVKFRQAIGNIPIYGSLVTVELENDNSLVSIDSALGEPHGVDAVASVSPADAAKAYQLVIDRSGDRLYGQMARLGLAEAQARAGQYDQAINAFKELAQRKDGPLPVDGILMQLGRAYLDAGRPNEAQQTFNRLVEEFPDSPFNAEAKRQLETLKKA